MNNDQAIRRAEIIKKTRYNQTKAVSDIHIHLFIVDEHGTFGPCAINFL